MGLNALLILYTQYNVSKNLSFSALTRALARQSHFYIYRITGQLKWTGWILL